MTADFVVLRCRKIFKIIPVGYGSRSRIGRIMNGYIIYLFDRNLWSGIEFGVRSSTSIKGAPSACHCSGPPFPLAFPDISSCPTEFHSVPCAFKNAYPNAHAAKATITMIHISTILCRILIGFFFSKTSFSSGRPEEVFFTETGRPLWDGLGDFTGLTFFPLLFIYTVVWSLFCDMDVMWM